MSSALRSSQADTQDMGRGTCTHVGTIAHEDITSFTIYCLLIAVKVQVFLPTVPGLVLVGVGAVKRDSLMIVLDFGLDVFCYVVES